MRLQEYTDSLIYSVTLSRVSVGSAWLSGSQQPGRDIAAHHASRPSSLAALPGAEELKNPKTAPICNPQLGLA